MKEAFCLDILVNDTVIIEVKATDHIHPIHETQLLTYLRLSNKRLGLLINFGRAYIKEGIFRVVNGM